MFEPTPLPHGLEIRMNSELENVDHAMTALRALLEQSEAGQHFFPLSLLAREALNNAMIHGNGLDPEKEVLFRVSLRSQGFRLEVTDQGPGFDWRKRLGSRSDIMQESGRGHEIFHFYASAVSYNEPGTHIILDYIGEHA